MDAPLPEMGAVFWPVGSGDSTTVVVSDQVVVQVDLRDMAKADAEDSPETAVVDRLVEALPTTADGKPYLAVFALTHADQDHSLGFADLLDRVVIGELWATPRLWREYEQATDDKLCEDAKAFQTEAERRVAAVLKAVEEGREPDSGDRVVVFGYDTDHDKHAYDELPEKYKSGPGKSITTLDGHDCAGRFHAFIHAPFADDCAAARNETSLAMQVTLTDISGQSGQMLLFGDLAHDTIMKIFNTSEEKQHGQYLEWDLLLAPHHCSKKVMYVPDATGVDIRQDDVLEAFIRYAGENPVIVSSSRVIPDHDEPGANPPHRKAADRYREIADDFVCTMSWPNADAPVPVVFAVDALGARLVREETVELAREMAAKAAAPRPARRLAAVAAAAAAVATAVATAGWAAGARQNVSGPDRLRRAIQVGKGGTAPAKAHGFGR
jgi:beta-lactamase superfamily II metal-dependent hydrolase